jgi:hypothetical protein
MLARNLAALAVLLVVLVRRTVVAAVGRRRLDGVAR